MLLAFSALLAVAVVVALRWLLLRLIDIRNPSLHVIDVAAFQNLLRPDDDLFLRRALTHREYRIAKRLRIRATQEYLLRIMHHCMAFQKMLPSSTGTAQAQTQVRLLSNMALKVRVMAVRLWLALWLQWLFPSLDIQPGSILDAYENLTVAASVPAWATTDPP